MNSSKSNSILCSKFFAMGFDGLSIKSDSTEQVEL